MRLFAALLFLGAQIAPGLHAAFEGGHDAHDRCTDGATTAHFDPCESDHGEAECPVCATVRAPLAAAGGLGPAIVVRAALRVDTPPDTSTSDPFHVQTPDSRGPPA